MEQTALHTAVVVCIVDVCAGSFVTLGTVGFQWLKGLRMGLVSPSSERVAASKGLVQSCTTFVAT
jgi:hypothetical protein